MKSFPLIKQPDAMDCGPACLSMIAKYYGKDYTLDRLRQQSFIGRDGVSLLGISRAAEKIGFRTVGGRLTFEKLAEKAPLPCIVHWNQDHFVVVYNVEKTKKGYNVFVADPGKGLVTYTKEEFCSHWISTQTNGEEKGVALLLEPTHLFYEKEGDELHGKKRLQFLWKYLIKYKRFFVQLILGLFIGSILQLIFPFLTQAIVDTGISGKDIGFIWLILIAQLMLLFSRTAIDFIRRKI
ncbi:MAG: peptidase domain-containing ABC transporter, partial [Tenacibaculum sp.]|nr:peptidase domain-containing ABC transporter [Tenacibaculum sp.]